MKMKLIAILTVLFGMLLTETKRADAQTPGIPNYYAIDLGTLGGEWSYANAINSSGQAVGYYNDTNTTYPGSTSHAFLYYNGSVQDLGTLGGGNSYAYA